MMDIEQRRVAIANLVGSVELQAALEKFIRGDLSADELETWANAVEGRDDIEFIPREIIDLIAEIANPVLFSPVNTDTARDLLTRIDALSAP